MEDSKKTNVLKEKSYVFALRIVKLSQYLVKEHKEYVLSKQVLRSGTSIGANLEEAFQGQSKLDFVHKLSIANKEAFETHYWLRLLRDSDILTKEQSSSRLADCDELQRMLVSAIKTSKAKL
ncbi:MAG: four helix bundle protein [Pyrinomonadaceae bacterium]